MRLRLSSLVLVGVVAASVIGAGEVSASASGTFPCTVKLSRPAPSKLVIKISKCSAPDVVEARFQLPGKLTISHATPFKVKFTTCKVVKKKTWDCHFGGGLPSGPTAKPVTSTLTLAAVGLNLAADDGYMVLYAVYSDGTKVKELARIPVAH